MPFKVPYFARRSRKNMLNLFKFFVFSNCITLTIVVAFEEFSGFFGLNHWSDYAFLVVMLLWAIAGLFFIYPPEVGFGNDKAERVAASMVDSSIADKIDEERFSSNALFCSKLFVSGLPAFLACLINDQLFL